MISTGGNSLQGPRSRLGRLLSGGLEKRLASYAAVASASGVGSHALARESAELITRAASAAGVGLVLAAGPASARIVYTPAYSKVCAAQTCSLGFPLDLDHNGIVDFKFGFRPATGSFPFSSMRVSPAQAGNAIVGNIQVALSARFEGPFTSHVASTLPAGHGIGPGSRFGAYQLMFGRYFFFSYHSLFTAQGGGPKSPTSFIRWGNWPNAQAPFLGLEFTAGGLKHFGWARLNWVNGTPTLTGYAYETEPGKAIRAGDTGPVADARVPEILSAPPTAATLRPATLGMLALGSAGLDIWRKEKDQ
jgi:hypothetical protein